jgi:hypothetical protein
LEETTYNPNDIKKHSLEDISAPVLEETTYVAPSTKKSLDDISAPVLEDTFVATPTKKHSLEGVSAPVLDGDEVSPTKETTTKPTKDLTQVSAPVLDDEPQQPKPYVSKYANMDVERAKQEGAKQAHKVEKVELTPEEQKKSREAYKELMRMQEEEMAKKGGKTVIVMVILGLLAMVGFHLFVTQPTYEDESILAIVDKIKGFIWYYDAIVGIVAFLLIPKVEGLKTLGSVVFGLNALVTLGLGIFLFSQMSSVGVNAVYFLVSLVFSGYITFQLSSNENVGKYYAKSRQY